VLSGCSSSAPLDRKVNDDRWDLVVSSPCAFFSFACLLVYDSLAAKQPTSASGCESRQFSGWEEVAGPGSGDVTESAKLNIG
jgi:hypothetical protein